MRSRLRALVPLLLALAASVCPAQQAEPAPPAAPLFESTVTLQDAGAEPRRVLRYTPAVGSTQATQMVIKMDQETDIAGQPPQRMPIPALNLPMAIAISAAPEGGDITEVITYGRPAVTGDDQTAQMAQMMNNAIAGLENATATATISSRGIVKTASFKLAGPPNQILDQTAGQMAQSLRQFSIPFPDEAVGIGAAWTVEFATDNRGVRSRQRISCTLRELTDTGCTLDTQSTQSADRQALEGAGYPAGAMLESLSGQSTGSSTIAFDRLLPISASSAGFVKTHITANRGGQPLDLNQTLHLALTLRQPADSVPQPAPAK